MQGEDEAVRRVSDSERHDPGVCVFSADRSADL